MPILTTLTGGAASYFWQGLATALPTGFTNVAPDTVILAHTTDTNVFFVWDHLIPDWVAIEGIPNIQLTGGPDYKLQYSLDSGVTWFDITGWDTNFPLGVQHFAPKITMVPGLSYPPIPSMASGGADYVYDPPYN
jgi:hypothetical protein